MLSTLVEIASLYEDIDRLGETIESAKKDIKSLIKVKTKDGNNVLDFDDKVRV